MSAHLQVSAVSGNNGAKKKGFETTRKFLGKELLQVGLQPGTGVQTLLSHGTDHYRKSLKLPQECPCVTYII